MNSKFQKTSSSFGTLVKTAASVPRWQAIGSALIVILVGTMILYALRGSQEVILGYYVVILTVLVWLTYEYAKSVEAMAKATMGLAGAGEKETLRSKTRRITEEGIILQELLDGLRKAEESRRPPFDLSAWEDNSARLETVREMPDFEKQKVASCYRHLVKQNTEVGRWQEFESRLRGLVNSVERRRTVMLLRVMEEENRSTIRSAISTLENYLL
jgi:hypothetical protein